MEVLIGGEANMDHVEMEREGPNTRFFDELEEDSSERNDRSEALGLRKKVQRGVPASGQSTFRSFRSTRMQVTGTIFKPAHRLTRRVRFRRQSCPASLCRNQAHRGVPTAVHAVRRRCD